MTVPHVPTRQVGFVPGQASLLAQLVPHVAIKFRFTSQPFAGRLSQLRVPPAHAVHTPPVQVCVSAVHATVAPHVASEPQVCTPLPTHCVLPGTHSPPITPP